MRPSARPGRGRTVQDPVFVAAPGRGEARVPAVRSPAPRAARRRGAASCGSSARRAPGRARDARGRVQHRDLARGVHPGIGAPGDDAGRTGAAGQPGRRVLQHLLDGEAGHPGSASPANGVPSYSSSRANGTAVAHAAPSTVPARHRVPAQEGVGGHRRAPRPLHAQQLAGRRSPHATIQLPQHQTPGGPGLPGGRLAPPAPSAPRRPGGTRCRATGLRARTWRSSGCGVAGPVQLAIGPGQLGCVAGARVRRLWHVGGGVRRGRAGSGRQPSDRPVRRAAGHAVPRGPIGTLRG